EQMPGEVSRADARARYPRRRRLCRRSGQRASERPSVRPRGQRMGVVKALDQLADVVPDVFDAPRQLIATDKLGSDTIPQGQRNPTLTSLAGSMRRKGFSTESIAAALHVENQRRCQPALGAAEVEEIAKSIGRYPAQVNGSVHVAPLVGLTLEKLTTHVF